MPLPTPTKKKRKKEKHVLYVKQRITKLYQGAKGRSRITCHTLVSMGKESVARMGSHICIMHGSETQIHGTYMVQETEARNKKNMFEARRFYRDLNKRAKSTYRISSATKGSKIPTENNFLWRLVHIQDLQ